MRLSMTHPRPPRAAIRSLKEAFRRPDTSGNGVHGTAQDNHSTVSSKDDPELVCLGKYTLVITRCAGDQTLRQWFKTIRQTTCFRYSFERGKCTVHSCVGGEWRGGQGTAMVVLDAASVSFTRGGERDLIKSSQMNEKSSEWSNPSDRRDATRVHQHRCTCWWSPPEVLIASTASVAAVAKASRSGCLMGRLRTRATCPVARDSPYAHTGTTPSAANRHVLETEVCGPRPTSVMMLLWCNWETLAGTSFGERHHSWRP